MSKSANPVGGWIRNLLTIHFHQNPLRIVTDWLLSQLNAKEGSSFSFSERICLFPSSANPERRRRSIYVWLSTFARLPLNARSLRSSGAKAMSSSTQESKSLFCILTLMWRSLIIRGKTSKLFACIPNSLRFSLAHLLLLKSAKPATVFLLFVAEFAT